MNATHGPEADREAEVLRQRARALARRQPVSAGGSVEVLDFSVGSHRCALDLRWVREVRPLKDLMPLPLAPAPSLGLVQLRGRMLPVIDCPGLVVAARPELGHGPALLLVLGRSRPEFGVAISAVHGLCSIDPEEAARRGSSLEGWQPEVVRGVTAEGQVLLDGERLLASRGRSDPDAVRVAAPHSDRQGDHRCRRS